MRSVCDILEIGRVGRTGKNRLEALIRLYDVTASASLQRQSAAGFDVAGSKFCP